MNKITIIGLGLMGCSIALAAKQQNPTLKINGFDANPLAMKEALKRGHIDQYDEQLTDFTSNSDLIIIAAPLHAVKQIFTTLNNRLSRSTVITDIGSVKQCVVDDAKKYFSAHYPQFVPGHPIAGSEKNSGAFANAELFHNKFVMLTPTHETDNSALAVVTAFWQQLSSRVVNLSPQQHDEIMAYTSHLPHAIAMALMCSSIEQQDKLNFTGSGFQSVTRIAKANPTIWRDIFLANKSALLKQLNIFRKQLNEFEILLKTQNEKKLLQWLNDCQQLSQIIQD